MTLAIIGYSSIDHSMHTLTFMGPGATTEITRSHSDSAGDAGGIAHVCRAAATRVGDCSAVSWIGTDGEFWKAQLTENGVQSRGVDICGSRTPRAHLFYPEDNDAICFFDPGDLSESLTQSQAEIIRNASVVLFTVGPTAPLIEAVDLVSPSARVIWVVKNDPNSLTPELVNKLGKRADLITLSVSERAIVERGILHSNPYVVITDGKRGSALYRATRGRLEARAEVANRAVESVNTTGAGDTYSGTLAAVLTTQPELNGDAITHAMSVASESVTKFLEARINDEKGSVHEQ
jgi:ribokinase